MTNVLDEVSSRSHRGRLTIVGSGIQAISQMTIEALSYIQNADAVFYHATNGVTASQIVALNPNSVDLYEYYGEGKERHITYIQMAELMLREVRYGRHVVGVFHGHPGYFVSPARRSLAIARAEGYPTKLIPAISAPDCMFADLRVDPGVNGCQILMASSVLRDDCLLATSCHLVFLQITAVGDSTFSFTGYKNSQFSKFIEKLISVYGETQEAIYYLASIFPGCEPEIRAHPLIDYLRAEVRRNVGSGILYVPPKGVSLDSLHSYQAFRGRPAYGRREDKAIQRIDGHRTPPNFLLRRASQAVLKVFSDIASDALGREAFDRSPGIYLASCPDLTDDERAAIASRKVSAIRRVTTSKTVETT